MTGSSRPSPPMLPPMEPSVSLDDIRAAANRLGDVAHRTPVVTSATLDSLVGGDVFAKAECFQRTGSFKIRGAYNAIASLSPSDRTRGVAAYSSGNHAQAVALAARMHDVPAVILMPEDAPASKLAATRGYGAEVVTYDRYRQERTSLGDQLAADRGLTMIPPFDHWDVIAGQGTVALELFDQVGGLDLLVVCVGGGGLISGCATVAKSLGDSVQVVGVEPEAGDDVRRSLLSGEIVTIPTPVTIADGQQTTAPGERTFAVIRERVDDVVTVTDDQILDAMRFVFERMNIVLEPSGACALAAILSGAVDARGRRVGVTLSGGNIDTARFVSLMK